MCVCVSVRLPASRALELEMYIIILFSQEASHCTLHMHSTYLSPKDSKGSHRHMEKQVCSVVVCVCQSFAKKTNKTLHQNGWFGMPACDLSVLDLGKLNRFQRHVQAATGTKVYDRPQIKCSPSWKKNTFVKTPCLKCWKHEKWDSLILPRFITS